MWFLSEVNHYLHLGGANCFSFEGRFEEIEFTFLRFELMQQVVACGEALRPLLR